MSKSKSIVPCHKCVEYLPSKVYNSVLDVITKVLYIHNSAMLTCTDDKLPYIDDLVRMFRNSKTKKHEHEFRAELLRSRASLRMYDYKIPRTLRVELIFITD
jgi:hypothetical protein